MINVSMLSKGDYVQLTRDYTEYGTQGRVTLQSGEILKVAQVGTYKVRLRTATGNLVWVFAEYLNPTDSDWKPPRKLGEKPDGDEYLPMDHPGIQWIFEDMGKFATDKGYCDTYDRLCDTLGIPGRKRRIKVTFTTNGVDVSATVEARSKSEAEALVREKLTNNHG